MPIHKSTDPTGAMMDLGRKFEGIRSERPESKGNVVR